MGLFEGENEGQDSNAPSVLKNLPLKSGRFLAGEEDSIYKGLLTSPSRGRIAQATLFRHSGLWIAAVLVLAAMGTNWAFSRGGQDFTVYYEAWKLVLFGYSKQIYHLSPDRYLYSPAFAWILAPLGYLPRSWALALWCAGKVLALGILVRKFVNILSIPSSLSPYRVGIVAAGILVSARPVLIDFTYGQINIFVLSAAVWALSDHLHALQEPDARLGVGRVGGDRFQLKNLSRILGWVTLSFLAQAKLFALPLLLVPYMRWMQWNQRVAVGNSFAHALSLERWTVFLSSFIFFLSPLLGVFSARGSDWLTLLVGSYGDWMEYHTLAES